MWAPIHMRKVFVGGIDYTTTDTSLKEHFSKYGEVVDSVVMKDPANNRSRGFGFVTFMNPEHVDAVQKARPHKIDGRLVETKRALPRTEQNNTPMIPSGNHPDAAHSRIFIGGLPQDVKEDDLETYFKVFGNVTCVNIMYDKTSGRHRGFAFVDYNDYDPVDKILLTRNHSIKGRPIDVKKAISKSDISKIKSFMTGVVGGHEANFLASLGAASNAGSPPANTPLPPPIGTLPIPGPSGNIVMNGTHGRTSTHGTSSTTNNVTTNTTAGVPTIAPGLVPPIPQLAHPFFPRLPLAGLPGFSAQLRSGWQYSISGNAEVLRNTAGAVSNRPSGAPALVPVASLPGVVPAAGIHAIESDGETDGSIEDQVMDTEDGSEVWGGAGVEDAFPPGAKLVIIEPFYGGSHKQLIDSLRNDESVIENDSAALFTLPGKKWHWRARTAALYFFQKIPLTHDFETLFASSTLNLCELIGLRPDLARLRKILYFHENQLVYPVRKQKDRDFQYGYNQIMSCLVADVIVFNSQYNFESFLREIPRHLKIQPDHRPDANAITQVIREKSHVIYFPVVISHKTRSPKDALEPLHIIWPHRWEHDKDPDTFFQVIYQLIETGLNFRLSVLGQSYSENPPIFNEARQKLANYIIHWGYADSKEKYWEVLHSGDVVVSTAHHEFFGVAMLEAVGAGCFPLCPNRLVYPEIFPQECLYNTTQQLQKSLAQWCTRPQILRSKKVNLDLNTFSWATLKQRYVDLLSQSSDHETNNAALSQMEQEDRLNRSGRKGISSRKVGNSSSELQNMEHENKQPNKFERNSLSARTPVYNKSQAMDQENEAESSSSKNQNMDLDDDEPDDLESISSSIQPLSPSVSLHLQNMKEESENDMPASSGIIGQRHGQGRNKTDQSGSVRKSARTRRN